MLRKFWVLNLIIVSAFSAILSMAGASTAVAAPAAPPTLYGEYLSGVPTITATCDYLGTSTISYTVTGSASTDSPYKGTFVESGTVTIGEQSAGSGAVLSFSATLAINKQVVATMALADPTVLAGNRGFCYEGLQSFGVEATYSAVIRAPGGLYSDSGRTGTALNVGTAYDPSQFIQFFQSGQFTTTPVH